MGGVEVGTGGESGEDAAVEGSDFLVVKDVGEEGACEAAVAP